jgi:RimJ/RimL family protein N-acetyltransferase
MSEAFSFKHQPIDLLLFTIKSERLRLVPISLEYDRDIFQEFTPEITTYMFPKPAEDISETRAFIKESLQDMKTGNNLQMVILKSSGEFLGCCGLHGQANPRIPEFGIWLKNDAHGYGYGREAIQALYTWAKQNLEVEYYIYPVDRNNLASRNIPESLGGAVVREFVDIGLAGNRLDMLVYKIQSQK